MDKALFVVPERARELAESLVPEQVCTVKYIQVPSVVTSGNIEKASKMLETLREKYSELVKGFESGIPKKILDMFEETTELHNFMQNRFPDDEVEVEEHTPKSFIRYVRVRDRDSGEISSHGGLAVIFELTPEIRKMRFAFAVCGKKERFSKKVAASVCISRLDSSDWYEISDYSDKYSLITNIYIALIKYLELALQSQAEFDIMETPVITTTSPRVRRSKLKQVMKLIEDHYIGSDSGSQAMLLDIKLNYR